MCDWFQSLKRDVAFFHAAFDRMFDLEIEFQSLKRDVAFFHLATSFTCSWLPTSFNRSSAMWPSSTAMWPSSTARKRLETVQPRLMFQSLKRDVAFFHIIFAGHMVALIIVSIAQARCGLLPLWLDCPCRASRQSFQSLKRDVAFFHLMTSDAGPSAPGVSIAQARCGLLPHEDIQKLFRACDVSIAQARCGLLPLWELSRAEVPF